MKRRFVVAAVILLILTVPAWSCTKPADDPVYDAHKNEVLTGYVTKTSGRDLSMTVEFTLSPDRFNAVFDYVKSLAGDHSGNGDETADPDGNEEPTPFVIILPEIPLSGGRDHGQPWKTGNMTVGASSARPRTRKTIDLPPDELDDIVPDGETVTFTLPADTDREYREGEYVAVVFDGSGKITAVQVIEPAILQFFKLFATTEPDS